MFSSLKNFIPFIIVTILAMVVEWAFGWARLLSPWAAISWGGLALAIGLMLASYMLRAWRVADHFSIRGHFGTVLSLNLQHNLWNNLLPMRAGELSFPLLMRQKFGTDPAYALAGLFWIRLVDAQVLAALALGSLLWLAKIELLALLLVLFALLAPFVFWLSRGWLARFCGSEPRVAKGNSLEAPIATLGSLPQKGSLKMRAQLILQKILSGLPRDTAHFARGVLLTWANWLVKLAALAWVLRQFSPMTWTGAGVGGLGGEVTSVLPIHAPGGFGTYEAGMLAALLPQGLSFELASMAAINTHLFLLGTSLVFGLLAMLAGGKSATMRH